MSDDESVDPPYLVPTHLREPQSIGPIPVRAFFVVLGVGLLLGAPVATFGRREVGDIGLWLVLVPIVLAIPFALPFLDPPAEHGCVHSAMYIAGKVVRHVTWTRWPPRQELLEADGVAAFLAVVNAYRRRDTLGLDEQPDIADLGVADGVVTVPKLGVRAVYRVPTLNLDTASAASRRGARAQWGGVLNALPHPIQVVIRGVPATTLPVLERIKAHGSAQAQDLAAWLGAHLHGAQLVDRERYLVVPAEDLEALGDRCASLEASMRRIGLPLERLASSEALRDALGGFLTPRRGQFGPAIVDVGAADRLTVDGEHVRAFDIGKLPPAIVTDWASPLLDGDLPLDVSIDIEPLDLAWAKLQLDSRRNALESSALTPGRVVAIEQVAGLRMAYERRQTLPMRLSVTIVVRGSTRAELERRTKRLRQRVKDLGAEARLLRWEQRAGWLAVAPLRRPPLPKRGHPVETGTVARTYPCSCGTLVVEGGVPFGVAASSPVTFSVAQPRKAGRKGWRHVCWYGSTGSGKSYSCKCYLSRERFANGLRIYGVDQDESEEFSGRFCTYLGGSRVLISNVDAAEAFDFDQVANPDVVIWNLHRVHPRDRGAVFAALVRKLTAYLLATRGRRAALVIDEAVTVTRQKDGEDALYDVATRGRHYGLELHTLTQLATTWFNTEIGRAVQGTSANQWYGQLEDRERDEMVKNGVKFSRDELDLIERAGQGEGLLVTGGRRVWATLYGHTSPAEFAAFHTDSEPEDDERDDRRNGHVSTESLVGSARRA
ncbi:MAG TPA: hypothetical protein VMS54_09235 [Vicinamibacterales bacterium]|nr:hypothetical protein [Vicinamibacterales bacterium]